MPGAQEGAAPAILSPLTPCHLPLTTYHLPLTTYCFLPTSYHLLLTKVLPAIFFIFSRARCDTSAQEVARQQERGQGEALLLPHEQAEVRARVTRYYLPHTTYLLPTYYLLTTYYEVRARVTRWREQHAAVPMDASRLALLELGLASHHAGMLPSYHP